MATNVQLQKDIKDLKEDLVKVRQSNSRLRDELAEIKSNYNSLVNSVNERLEDVRTHLFREQDQNKSPF
mgnify:CR=1 FL=1